MHLCACGYVIVGKYPIMQVEKRLEHALIKGIDEFAVVGE